MRHKRNELQAVYRLLGRMDLQGRVVTGEAQFPFTLPAAEVVASLADRSGQTGRQRVRVLAVGDAQELQFVRDALTGAGYEVTATGDPQEAQRLMEREQSRLAYWIWCCPEPTASS